MALEFSFVNIPLFSLICLAYVAPLSFHQNDSLPCSLHSIVLAVYVTFLLLLRRFSRVRLCATPQMAAHQAPLSPGFSRQEHWSGLPFPSPLSYLSLFSQLEMLFFQLLQIADSHCIWYIRKKKRKSGDFPGGPVVKTSPFNAGGAGQIPDWKAKIPYALQQKNQKHKNRSNIVTNSIKDLKNDPQDSLKKGGGIINPPPLPAQASRNTPQKPLPKGHISLECESQFCLLLSGLLSYLTTFLTSFPSWVKQGEVPDQCFFHNGGSSPCTSHCLETLLAVTTLCGQQPTHCTETRRVALCLQCTGQATMTEGSSSPKCH